MWLLPLMKNVQRVKEREFLHIIDWFVRFAKEKERLPKIEEKVRGD